ncbi:MAG: hypothetical protein JST92_04575, partial [Deltaproteobacteria bacterium]|nr:hypothetical protein [Deltaproteobacteria bacterium]
MTKRFARVLLSSLCAVLFTTACYDPTITDGRLHCGSDAECPDGFVCAKDNKCWHTEVKGPSAFEVTLAAGAAPITGTALTLHVRAVDKTGAVITGYLGTVKVTSTDGFAALPADYTFTAGDAGAHDLAYTPNTAGTSTITVTDAAAGGLTGSLAITVTPLAAQSLRLSALPSDVTAGAAQQFTLSAVDAQGHTLTTYRGVAHFTSTDARATLPADYTFTSLDSGAHTFTTGVAFETAGTQTLTATDDGQLTVTSGGVLVSPAAAASLTLTSATSTVAGLPVSLGVAAFDAFGNAATSASGTLHVTSTDAAASLPADTALVAGSSTLSVTLVSVGTQTITVT